MADQAEHVEPERDIQLLVRCATIALRTPETTSSNTNTTPNAALCTYSSACLQLEKHRALVDEVELQHGRGKRAC
jgi:hypothetical protein